jgi:hypothetical protein
MLGKFGWTADMPKRFPELCKDHPGCMLLMLVLTGTHNAKPVKTMKHFSSYKMNVQVREGKTYRMLQGTGRRIS